MAAPVCVLHRTLIRSRGALNQASCPSVCRDLLYVVDVHRYTRDPGFSIYFPHSVLHGADLYDVILTDGHCRLQVTVDPPLRRLVETNVLRRGVALRHASFSPALTAQLPQSSGASEDGADSYRLVSAEVIGQDEEDDQGGGVSQVDDWTSLPWFRTMDSTGHVLPLRANRTVFLPLWNNTDFIGAGWREAPPTDDDDDDDADAEEAEVRRASVTVAELRTAFLSGHRSVTGGVVRKQLIGRIVNKSRLMYYGRQDQNCECPYKVELDLVDPSGLVCVVLWNSVCLNWYRRLKPGDVISLSRFKVKQNYRSNTHDIEVSVNSRNPRAQICVLPESSVLPEDLPPAPEFTFYNSLQLLDRPHGVICDVIGLLTFSGRPERIRTKDAHGVEFFLEYRWLRLEDGSSDYPVMVKLFSTSQPDVQRQLHPLSVVVCSRVKVIRVDQHQYLRNTTYTQVYCTGQGHHSVMGYRKLHPVRDFIRWLRSQDDRQVQSRALVGGFFVYPPPPVSLETFMKHHRGSPGFLQGAELQAEIERLCYRERRTFCIQATVTMVTHCRAGQVTVFNSSSFPCVLLN
uniref:RPA-related protein RADX-like n=1 Tax=Sphaeramia orbicularis TaxID=375764 RepID=A0A672Y7V9_9TELE